MLAYRIECSCIGDNKDWSSRPLNHTLGQIRWNVASLMALSGLANDHQIFVICMQINDLGHTNSGNRPVDAAPFKYDAGIDSFLTKCRLGSRHFLFNACLLRIVMGMSDDIKSGLLVQNSPCEVEVM